MVIFDRGNQVIVLTGLFIILFKWPSDAQNTDYFSKSLNGEYVSFHIVLHILSQIQYSIVL